MCVGLGFERHQFQYKLGEEQSSTLRLLHYPSRLHDVASIPADAWDGKTPIVTGEHHDTSVITVLATFNMSGLQIKPPGYVFNGLILDFHWFKETLPLEAAR